MGKMNVSDKILAIRAKHGNPNTNCPTCTHSAESPFRRYVDGVIVAGCIDAIHTGHLGTITNTNHWHVRKVAEQMRREELTRISR